MNLDRRALAHQLPPWPHSENSRARRKQLGLSQETLAENADRHPDYVGSVERGEENVSIDNLVRIAKALHVAAHDLVMGI